MHTPSISRTTILSTYQNVSIFVDVAQKFLQAPEATSQAPEPDLDGKKMRLRSEYTFKKKIPIYAISVMVSGREKGENQIAINNFFKSPKRYSSVE